MRQELGRGVAPRERRFLVEVAVIERGERRAQHLGRQADVNDHAVHVERRTPEFQIDDERRAVEALRGTEGLAVKTVGDHEMVADRNGVHRRLRAGLQARATCI